MSKLSTFFILFFLSQLAFSQTFTIRGFVTDQTNGERLLNANVYEQKILRGTISNNFGFYSLTLPKGSYSIACSFVGYQTQLLEIDLTKDTIIDFKLATKADLDEVTVVGQKVESKLTSTQMSRVDIQMDKVQSLPAFLGEADVIKTIQLLPGVQSGTEGTSGLYVRGGGPDQNLILLDDVPVYNAEHLFGFFSVFNPDAIKSVSFYKGGFPARFGGRLSSVLDIRMKDGNEKELHGNFSIGLISSKINLEGPIVKDKTTFNFSARRTYADLLARPLITSSSNGDDVGGYFFHDLNMKVTHKFSDRSRVYLSGYTGRDKAYYRSDSKYTYKNENNTDETVQNKDKFSLGWGNITTALRWNFIFSNKLFANTTLTYSRYLFDVMENSTRKNLTTGKNGEEFGLNYKSGIEDFGLKMDFDYFPASNHRVKFGGSIIDHTFRPGILAFKESDRESTAKIDTAFGNPNIRAQEMYAYIEDNFDLSARLSVNVGLHSSGFLVDNTFYASLQPRISARYMASDRLSLKAAYSKMSQNIHLLSSSTINLPTDLWLPTTKKVKPQTSHQFALGGVYKVNPAVDFSIEGFYKSMTNLLEYKEGASFVGATTGWEDKVEMGKGWSYGAEFLLEKTIGKTTGWIGYTWSKAERQFDNLNWGRKFYARYDRRHDGSFVMTHKFSKRFDVGMTWVYGTGNAVTLPTQNVSGAYMPYINQFTHQSNYEYFGQRNNYRMPSYHRMDVGFNFHKQKKHGIRTWNLSFYNAYSRQNPFFLYFEQTSETEYNQTGKSRKLTQLSLFPIIPSISYSYKF
ncbi:MAG: carboxypeptidase-like regulatory domain-containing protein [Bacteroidota bacterium]|nr:carboxypeptidase-like regulatory domain-containing protein [Bacteroidota bacterium]